MRSGRVVSRETSDARLAVIEVEMKGSGSCSDRGTLREWGMMLPVEGMSWWSGAVALEIQCARGSGRLSATVTVVHVAGKLSDTGFDTSDSRFDC
jgi:hypothetical protein